MAKDNPGRVLASVLAGVVTLGTLGGLALPMGVLTMGESGQRDVLAGDLLTFAVLATMGTLVALAVNFFFQSARARYLLIGTGILLAGGYPLVRTYTDDGDRFPIAAATIAIVGSCWIIATIAVGLAASVSAAQRRSTRPR